MGEIKRLNIEAAIAVVRGRTGIGIERIPNEFYPDDLRAFRDGFR